MLPAYYLPSGVEAPEATTWKVGPEGWTCAGPCVTPAWIEDLAARLRRGGESLRRRSTGELVDAVGRTAERWLDRGDPFRSQAEEWLPRLTGYAPATIRDALDTLFAGLRPAPLDRLLRSELGEPAVLDTFVLWQPPTLDARRSTLDANGDDLSVPSSVERRASSVGGCQVRALGPRLVVVWASGNVPVAAVPALCHALVLKSPCLVKTAASDPLLPALVARSLAAEAPWLGDALAALHWSGEDAAIGPAALRHADAVVAFGSATTLATLRTWVPATARFRAHGHRIGFGLVGREALAAALLGDTAANAARDVALFDQQGCMSPHLLYVEEGGEESPRALAGRIAEELAAWEARAPRRSLAPDEASAIHQLRAAYEMRALARPDVALLASPAGTAWTVVLDPEPGFAPSCLNRTLFLRPIPDLGQVPDLLAPVAPYLQTAVYAMPEPRLAELAERLAPLGVTRLAPLGRAQEPCLAAPHDGHPRVADLVRWTTREEMTR